MRTRKYTPANTATRTKVNAQKQRRRDAAHDETAVTEVDTTDLLTSALQQLIGAPEAIALATRVTKVALGYRLSRAKAWLGRMFVRNDMATPKWGTRYFYVDGLGRTLSAYWHDSPDDRKRLEISNFFGSEKLAAAASEMQCHIRRTISHVVFGGVIEERQRKQPVPRVNEEDIATEGS